MKELIVGSGGREHAIGWKLHEDNPEDERFFAPGNAGTAELGKNIDLRAEDISGIRSWVHENEPRYTIIGPEVPLRLGLANNLRRELTRTFGPTQEAAKLEWSKVFAKEFMVRNNIPTARFKVFDSLSPALQHIHDVDYPFVIKASGLAEGKGVIIPESTEEAKKTLVDILEKHSMGDAGREVIIEEKLEGKELSVLAFSDGYEISIMPYARDHKRLLNEDKGPNTGGMGAFAPVHIDEVTREFIEWNILRRTIYNMHEEGAFYKGVLYAGLILTESGPKVLEYNCRFGDPETQVILPLLDTPLLEIADAVAEGHLPGLSIRWKKEHAVSVGLAAKGYPDNPQKGDVIYGLDTVKDKEVIIFHAGTKESEDDIVTNGGRVLSITAKDTSLIRAQRKAYGVIGLGGVYFEGMQYRTDIGASGI